MAQLSPSAVPSQSETFEALLVRARQLLQSLQHPKRVETPAPSSICLYRRLYAQLVTAVNEHKLSVADALAKPGTRPMFLQGRKAVRFYEGRVLREALEELDAWRTLGVLPPNQQGLIERVTRAVEWLSACDQAPGDLARRRPHARRRNFHKLPSDWQEALLRHASPALRPALRIMSLTGCRPKELLLGVRVRIRPADDAVALELRVQNAKNGSLAESAHRSYYFRRGAEQVDGLIQELTQLPPWPKKDLFDPDDGHFCAAAVSKRVECLSKQIWPNRKYRPSAYSYRYAFRAKLKSLGFSAIEIAEALGHSSLATQSYYGRGYARGPVPERDFSFCGSIPVRRYPDRELKKERFFSRVLGREWVFQSGQVVSPLPERDLELGADGPQLDLSS